MILSTDGRVLALDGKVTLDDNAAFRQAEDFEKFADQSTTTRSRRGPRPST